VTARIDWSPDGTELLTCIAGTVRRHAVGGGSTVVEGPDLLDARWRGDGTIAMVDARGAIHRHAPAGAVTVGRGTHPLVQARIAGGTDCYLGRSTDIMRIARFDGEALWDWNAYKHGLAAYEHRITAIAVSDDAGYVAIGHEKRGEADFSGGLSEGRGWLVIDVETDRIVDRSWTRIRREPASQQLVFDRASRRLAIATPERGPCCGAIRIDRDERYARGHEGGSRAVAFDARGIVAVYAHPPDRLRVDYLEPGAKGGSAIQVLDTLWITHELDDVIALAIHASRRIACVSSTARVDIVPVP
jgi:hypothetical protein